jgi:hypothetical protein
MNLGDKQEKTVSSAVPDATLGTSRIGNLVPEKEDNSPNIELLGGIYRLVLRSIEHEMREDEEEHQRIKDSEKDEDNRNKEIIKALTGRKKQYQYNMGANGKTGGIKDAASNRDLTLPKPPTSSAPTTATVTPVTTGGGAVGAAATAVAVGAGTILGSLSLSLKAKISGRESAGMTEKSYNIMNIAPGEKGNAYEVVKGNSDISGNAYQKNLTDMNIGEVIQLANQRGAFFNKKGAGKASGKYQFMPNTLKGLAKATFGENWESIQYSPENQEKLMDVFVAGNATSLQKAGLPVSDASLYMMHFFGNTKQTAMVLDERNNDVLMKDILGPTGSTANPTIAAMTVGEYKQKLRKDIKNKKGEITKPGFTFEPIDVKIGDSIGEKSKQNEEAKKELKKKSSGTVTNNTTVNENQSSGNSESNVAPDDRPIILKKAD